MEVNIGGIGVMEHIIGDLNVQPFGNLVVGSLAKIPLGGRHCRNEIGLNLATLGRNRIGLSIGNQLRISKVVG